MHNTHTRYSNNRREVCLSPIHAARPRIRSDAFLPRPSYDLQVGVPSHAELGAELLLFYAVHLGESDVDVFPLERSRGCLVVGREGLAVLAPGCVDWEEEKESTNCSEVKLDSLMVLVGDNGASQNLHSVRTRSLDETNSVKFAFVSSTTSEEDANTSSSALTMAARTAQRP